MLPEYKTFHKFRSNCRGGGICVFSKDSFSYKERKDLDMISDNLECMCLEIVNDRSKNILLNLTYRPPNGIVQEFENHISKVILTKDVSRKELIIVGDFNLNLLDFCQNSKIRSFVNLMFRYGLISMINKPTRVTRKTATAIDHIYTNISFHTAKKKLDY